MNVDNSNNINIFRDFFAISYWETLVILIAIIVTFIGMNYLTKKFRLKFQYRILMGIGLGVIFGIAIAASDGFRGNSDYIKDDGSLGSQFRPSGWVSQIGMWFYMIRTLFVSGLMIMIMPIIFLAMARVVSKQSETSLKGITWKGIVVLLFNVAIAFTLTFWLGILFQTGSGFTLNPDAGSSRDPMKSITDIIGGYMPSNFFAVMAGGVIIPTLVLGSIVGYAIKKSTKRNPESMQTARKGLERGWIISNSVLMWVIKFMPYAVFAMIGRAIMSRPIGEFAHIGWIIGLGYLGLVISYGINVLTIWFFGINTVMFIKKSFSPIMNGFVTQSSMATLPMALEVMKTDMNLKDANGPSVIMPLSTTMGLMGCAGVQAGVVLSLLANANGVDIGMGIFVFFLLGLIITIITSLGIAGVPGTATIVTIGVVTTIGLPGFVNPVIDIISPLNGIFDMGRTAVNVSGGMTAALVASQLEGEIPQEMQAKSPISALIKRANKKREEKNSKNEV